MLYFATKPDSVYSAVVDAALTDACSWVSDPRRCHAHAPHIVEGFPGHEAPQTALPKLQAAHRQSTVYRMNHFFWVFLYDVMSGYASRHNARFHGRSGVPTELMPMIGSFRCGPLRMASIVATFWWDLDCFPEVARDMTLVSPPPSHRNRGGRERYAPVGEGLVEIRHPKWARNPDAAELETPGLIVPRYPLFTAPVVADTW